jgi:hypothetical protein
LYSAASTAEDAARQRLLPCCTALCKDMLEG